MTLPARPPRAWARSWPHNWCPAGSYGRVAARTKLRRPVHAASAQPAGGRLDRLTSATTAQAVLDECGEAWPQWASNAYRLLQVSIPCYWAARAPIYRRGDASRFLTATITTPPRAGGRLARPWRPQPGRGSRSLEDGRQARPEAAPGTARRGPVQAQGCAGAARMPAGAAAPRPAQRAGAPREHAVAALWASAEPDGSGAQRRDLEPGGAGAGRVARGRDGGAVRAAAQRAL